MTEEKKDFTEEELLSIAKEIYLGTKIYAKVTAEYGISEDLARKYLLKYKSSIGKRSGFMGIFADFNVQEGFCYE